LLAISHLPVRDIVAIFIMNSFIAFLNKFLKNKERFVVYLSTQEKNPCFSIAEKLKMFVLPELFACFAGAR